MAQIPIYQNVTTPQQPPNVGTEASISAARRVGALEREGGTLLAEGVKAVGKVASDYFQNREDTEANKEIREGLVLSAEMEAKHTNLLQTAADSGDPLHPQTFNDHALTPDGEAFLSRFKTEKGRKWAEDHVASYTASAIRQSTIDHAIASGNETLVSVEKLKNSAVSQISLNPGSADFQRSKFNKGIDALIATSGMKPAEASKVGTLIRQHGMTELSAEEVRSTMDRSPEAGIKLLESGKLGQYLPANAVEALYKYAEGRVRNQRSDEAATRAADNHERTELDRTTQDDYIGQLRIDDKGNTIYPPGFGETVINDPRLQPSTKRVLLNQYKTQLAHGASKTSDEVRNDLTQRLMLPDDDPRHLTRDTLLEYFGDGRVQRDDFGIFLGQIKQYEKDPAAKSLLAQTFKEARQTLNPDNVTPAPETRFNAWFWPQYQSGLKRGLTPQQLLDPESKDYLLKGDRLKTFQAAAAADAVKPVQERQSSNVVQKTAASAVDIALQVEGLGRNNNPEAVNEILKAGGVKLDVRDSQWCAALVNSTLKQVGLPGTGSQLASSFRTWGFPVDTQHIQKGDVFIGAPGEGYTGHVGFATGNVRSTPNGMQVQVISSHLQGKPENPGGVEWRNANNLMFRRAQPSVADIDAARKDNGVLGKVKDFWNYAVTPPNRVRPPAAVADIPPGSPERPDE